MGCGVCRLDSEGFPVLGDGIVAPPEAGQGHPKADMHVGGVGLEVQGLLVLGDGLPDQPAIGQRHAKTVPRPRVVAHFLHGVLPNRQVALVIQVAAVGEQSQQDASGQHGGGA